MRAPFLVDGIIILHCHLQLKRAIKFILDQLISKSITLFNNVPIPLFKTLSKKAQLNQSIEVHSLRGDIYIVLISSHDPGTSVTERWKRMRRDTEIGKRKMLGEKMGFHGILLLEKNIWSLMPRLYLSYGRNAF